MKEPKRNRIPGITGFGHWFFLEKKTGAKDIINGQYREGSESTPWIEQKISFAGAHINDLYDDINNRLKEVYRDIVTGYEEIQTMEKEAGNPESSSGKSEKAMRQAAEALAKREASKERRRSIILHLAQCKAELDDLDEELGYRIDRTLSILRTHIAAYWQGALKAADGVELPPFPPVELKKPRGQDVYEQYKRFANDLLSRVLSYEEEGDVHEVLP